MAKRTLLDHPKLARLIRRLGRGRLVAIGALELVWHFTARFAPSGAIGAYDDAEIEEWIGWDGPPGTLIESLCSSGWLDVDPTHRLLVHDWPDHCDDSVHATLARRRQYFADGTPPRLRGLYSHERAEATAYYQHQPLPPPPALPMDSPWPMPSTSLSSPHGIPTGHPAVPCPAMPCHTPPLSAAAKGVCEDRSGGGTPPPRGPSPPTRVADPPAPTTGGAAGDPIPDVASFLDRFYRLLVGLPTGTLLVPHPSRHERETAAAILDTLGPVRTAGALPRIIAELRRAWPEAKRFAASVPYWNALLARQAAAGAAAAAREAETARRRAEAEAARQRRQDERQQLERIRPYWLALDPDERRRRLEAELARLPGLAHAPQAAEEFALFALAHEIGSSRTLAPETPHAPIAPDPRPQPAAPDPRARL